MQRLLPSGIAAAFSILALASVPACQGDKDGAGKPDAKANAAAEQTKTGETANSGTTADGGAESGAPVAPSTGTEPTPDSDGGAEAGPSEAGGGEAGEAAVGGETGAAAAEEDVVPGLFELAKNLDTADDAAKQALVDALAAGAAKMDAAKIANARGEALLGKGEGERAVVFFEWAATTHTLYSEPVYNLATVAAYAGDLEVAKEHLQELQKRGNKKLMKKVGVDPAFALLIDDAEVRKIYEQ